jgi:hypothetical protein
MTSSPRVARPDIGPGDSAVDGLLAGTGAGLLMALYVGAVGRLSGQAWRDILAQFDPSPAPSPFTGVVAHLAVAGVHGLVFALAWHWLRRAAPRVPGWLAGLVYGPVLWLLAVVLLRLSPAATPEGWLAGVAPVHLAVAHLIYGLALGWLLGRRALVPEHSPTL